MLHARSFFLLFFHSLTRHQRHKMLATKTVFKYTYKAKLLGPNVASCLSQTLRILTQASCYLAALVSRNLALRHSAAFIRSDVTLCYSAALMSLILTWCYSAAFISQTLTRCYSAAFMSQTLTLCYSPAFMSPILTWCYSADVMNLNLIVSLISFKQTHHDILWLRKWVSPNKYHITWSAHQPMHTLKLFTLKLLKMLRHVSIIRSSSGSCLILAKITLLKTFTAWFSYNNLLMWQHVCNIN